jgi:hypothetical protein
MESCLALRIVILIIIASHIKLLTDGLHLFVENENIEAGVRTAENAPVSLR